MWYVSQPLAEVKYIHHHWFISHTCKHVHQSVFGEMWSCLRKVEILLELHLSEVMMASYAFRLLTRMWSTRGANTSAIVVFCLTMNWMLDLHGFQDITWQLFIFNDEMIFLLVTVVGVAVSAIFCHSRLVEQMIAPPLFLKTAEFRTVGRGWLL